MPEFSIVIPVYNAAKYLRECLDSVQESVRGLRSVRGVRCEVEVICVDDGSTDGSGAILDEYAERAVSEVSEVSEVPGGSKLQRFKVVHQRNAGVSAARNRGLEIATGEWVWFVDADDTLRADALERFAAVDRKADVNYFNVQVTDMEGGTYTTTLPEVRCLPMADAAVKCCPAMVFDQEIDTFGITWGKIVKRELAQSVRFDPEISSYEDLLYTLRVCDRARTFSCLTPVLYKYRITPTSLSHRTLSPEEDLERLRMLATVFRRCGDGLSMSGLKKIAYSRFLCFHCRSKIGWTNWREAKSMAKTISDYRRHVKPHARWKVGWLMEKAQPFPLVLALMLWCCANLLHRYVVNFQPASRG